MYTLKLKHYFDSAHHLINYKGKCANIHGHRWNVEVKIQTYILKDDMVLDFTIIKTIINELDHQDLNVLFLDINPTAENIAKYLYDKIQEKIQEALVEIILWESPEASITYSI